MGPIWQRVSTPLLRRSSSYNASKLRRSIATGYFLNRQEGSQCSGKRGPLLTSFNNRKGFLMDKCKQLPMRPEKVGLLQHFVRLKSGDNADLAGELQTSIVSYRKKIPWLFSDPFLKVDLVSEVHTADKQQRNIEEFDFIPF